MHIFLFHYPISLLWQGKHFRAITCLAYPRHRVSTLVCSYPRHRDYSKIENEGREATVQELIKMANLFEMTIDQIINYEDDIPTEITLKDKSILEQNRLFDDLDEEDRKTVFKIVDKMLTTKKFNTFFQENLQK